MFKWKSFLNLWRSKSIVLTVLSIFLGLFFILMGLLKVSPKISIEIHREFRRNFIRFAKIIPIVSDLGYRISPKWYRLIFGSIEIVSGLILVLVPFKRLKFIANILLLGLTILSMINHYRAAHKFDRIAPCIVFALMLACRIIVEYQIEFRDRNSRFIRSHRRKQSINSRSEILSGSEQNDSNDLKHFESYRSEESIDQLINGKKQE
ncbi:glucose-fructose oxidoreductase domain-containing protein 2 [Sarcoptes scabiei]|nr:glucose-fructose oxidoreductase domain-containing protein 2 [Sarcoptes scabiei]